MVMSSRIMACARHIATSVRPVLPARSRLTVAFWRDLGSGHEPRAVARLVTRTRVDADGLEAISRPRTDLLLERDCGEGRFEAVEGPVRDYARTVLVAPATAVAGGDRY